MTELEYLNRVAQLGCDTCCITIESDGSRTHEPTCQLNNLRAELAQARAFLDGASRDNIDDNVEWHQAVSRFLMTSAGHPNG